MMHGIMNLKFTWT